MQLYHIAISTATTII